MQQNSQTATQAVTTSRHEPRSDYVTQSFYDWLEEVSNDFEQTTIRGDNIAAELWRRASQLLVAESRLLE
jgi:hypothetical protein